MTKVIVHPCAQLTMTALVIVSSMHIKTVMSLLQLETVQLDEVTLAQQQHQSTNWKLEVTLDTPAKEKHQVIRHR